MTSMPFSIEWCDEVDSTNTQLKQRIAEGQARDCAVLVAKHQNQGRGQFERVWHDVPGTSLSFSLLWRMPPLLIAKNSLSLLPLVVAVALHQALQQRLNDAKGGAAHLQLKWPNDLMLNGAKLAGVLVETRLPWAVIGVGINVLQKPDRQLLEQPAACLAECLPHMNYQEMPQLLAEVLARFEALLPTFFKSSESLRAVLDYFNRSFFARGRIVELLLDETVFRGFCLGVDEQGALMLSNGLHPKTAAEIRHFFSGRILQVQEAEKSNESQSPLPPVAKNSHELQL